jgi:hypothetical protein
MSIVNKRMKRFLASLLILGMLYTPIAPTETAHAGGGGIGGIVFDPTNLTEAIVSNSLIGALVTKEYALDGIAYGIARVIIQQMVQSVITWINSGFEGSPAFVTDLERYLQNVADQIVSDTLLGSDLAFLCDPFELDVRIAIAASYNASRDGLGDLPPPACTLDDVSDNIDGFLSGDFTQGGWGAWFELTQGEANDPNRAFFLTQYQLQKEIADEQREENQLLSFGDGFLSFRVCEETAAQGGARENCTVTTPGRVIADQLNSSLNAGRDMLITADEIDEIIGALLAQLAQQALTGTFGLLGLGGNSQFTDASYGDGSNLSYLDALAAEQVETSGGGAIVFDDAISQTERYITAVTEVDTAIADVREEYDDTEAVLTANGCTVPDWPADFAEIADGASTELEQYATVALVLEELRNRAAETTDPVERSAILEQYNTLEREGLLPTTAEITQAEFYAEFGVGEDIRILRDELDDALDDCGIAAP